MSYKEKILTQNDNVTNDSECTCGITNDVKIARSSEEFEFIKIRRVLSQLRRGVDDYRMIDDGDRIAVGISGGKDSITLLCALINLSIFYPNHFTIVAITVDTGFSEIGLPDMDFSLVSELCEKYEVEYEIVRTSIAKIIFEERKESNPCSLCAKMRRGILHDAAKRHNCNKIALGHHFDDAVNTFMLNLIHEGRIGSFSPVTYLCRKDITLIRPMIYVHEKDIIYFINKNPQLPIVHTSCPEDKQTEREEIKKLIDELEKKYKGLKHRIFIALQNSGIDGYSTKDVISSNMANKD